MCGICGIVSVDGGRPIDPAPLEGMNQALRHRGPDDSGVYQDDFAALGHRRLSIIDVERGHQPLCNESRSVWVVFNGEIYNFPELQKDLEARGHRFSTRTDTEVLVHLYETYGPDFIERLNGMFAFALWDAPARRLILARDRMGEKPLHYTVRNGLLIFGSELKAILKHPAVSRRIDRSALQQYLLLDAIPAPRTIYEEVCKLPPGHRLVVEAGRFHVEPYWQLRLHADYLPEDEAGQRLEALLEEAVRIRLVSDVPLGLWLSGGLDSSLVAALASESHRRLSTFSIRFAEASFDESAYAREVARFLGTDHHEFVAHVDQMPEILTEIAPLMDEPMADGSLLPTFLLSRLTRQHVTVVLSGDGADELFAGYPTYPAHWLAELYSSIMPMAVRNAVINPVVRALVQRLPVSEKYLSLDYKLKRFTEGLGVPLADRHAIWMGTFPKRAQERLLLPEWRTLLDPYETLHERIAAGPELPVSQVQWLDQQMYLPDQILVKVDRATMACSLESRAPYLDHRVVEFANRLPQRYKLRRLRGKHLLKKYLGRRLPHGVVHRPKHGFAIPKGLWLRTRLSSLVQHLLGPDRLKAQGIFDPACVAALIDHHQRRKHDYGKELWTLLVFQMWHEHYA
ncbi:MAG: asparagine synthase (glutamine-hydrolyzing) [Planctomycetes bacterium]|nr:asparagine synthase (glutamine-hydrolyzing) [Planctomycetota bacterium]